VLVPLRTRILWLHATLRAAAPRTSPVKRDAPAVEQVWLETETNKGRALGGSKGQRSELATV
jgi:hypothetical protein